MDQSVFFNRTSVVWLLLWTIARPSVSTEMKSTQMDPAVLTRDNSSASKRSVAATANRFGRNYTVFACQNGTFTWKNPTGEQTLVVVNSGRTNHFNLCLQLQKMPQDLSISITAVRDVSIRITRIFTPSLARTCFHSYCGNVTLILTAVDSTGRNEAMTEQSISLKFTADNIQTCSKCGATCMAHCACKSSYVLGGQLTAFQEEYQHGANLTVYQVYVREYYRYNGTFNPDFIPYLSSVNDRYIFADAPRYISIVAQCKLEVGQTYFFSGDGLSSSNVLGLGRVSLCCMGYSRKHELNSYITKILREC